MRFVLMLLVLTARVTAQTPTVNFGEEFTSTHIFGNVPIILGSHQGNTYLLRIEGQKPNPAKIDYTAENSSAFMSMALAGVGVLSDDEGMFNLENYTNVDLTNWLSKVNVVIQKFDASYNLVYSKPLVV